MASVHRLVLKDFVSRSLCKELEFIHKSCSAVGYRPHVRSTTLSHLIATNCGGLVVPFLTVRERLKELVEAQFGCEFELFNEFTGLISWIKGAQIGWHSDDNRPYLKQRHFAAVCYLNDCQVDFQGGLFHFREGEPTTVVPTTGTVVIYSADETNTHCVDQVLSGERCTLALWFTKDSAHDEDRKLIQQLSAHLQTSGPNAGVGEGSCREPYIGVRRGTSSGDSSFQWYPTPASTNMYWEGHGEPGTGRGYDVRRARLGMMGYDILPAEAHVSPLHRSGEERTNTSSETERLSVDNQPVMLQALDKSFLYTFRNSLHAIQVLEFRTWQSFCESAKEASTKCSSYDAIYKHEGTAGTWSESSMQPTDIDNSLTHHVCSIEQAERHWERYISNLWKDLLILLPQWLACQSLFP